MVSDIWLYYGVGHMVILWCRTYGYIMVLDIWLYYGVGHMVILWCRTYGYIMVSDIWLRTSHIKRGVTHELLFLISNKGSFICTVPQNKTMILVTPVVIAGQNEK